MDPKEIIIAGQVIPLHPLDKRELKGIYTDALIRYAFYEAEFQGNSFLVLESKRSVRQTPLQYKVTADIIQAKKNMPCVFIFDTLAYYERNRLIERGVYFIVSDKFVFLPYLLINAKAGTEVNTERLAITAQYILLYHLQCKCLDGYTLTILEKELPYKYVTLSRAVRQLEAMSLIRVSINDGGTKVIHFEEGKVSLWKKIEPLLQTPIRERYHIYNTVDCGVISGVNALAHYSSLNPDGYAYVALDIDTFKSLKSKNELKGLNKQEDGKTILEVWKYHPLTSSEDTDARYVDKLSLYLSLRNDKDPRIEKELEIMLEKMGLKS
ncbi:hypothetical protein [Parabacteroides sp. AM08-6]|uniref:hypothetical protein n=1 Tax=Parabacteroides sp. AM08-6 TaxID=2292053 RepID=UPI000EFE2E31|nr:hypothetical protein [Parabacteroides sp. AM08-6]RHJ82570.1 hypothetical protein DW103_09500 [Parabacteroides sp. AM08-6]